VEEDLIAVEVTETEAHLVEADIMTEIHLEETTTTETRLEVIKADQMAIKIVVQEIVMITMDLEAEIINKVADFPTK
jgi:hypothetical protein